MNDQIDALKALQMALARLGYYSGAIDGLFGPRTDAALKAVAAEGGAIHNLKPLAVSTPTGPMIFQGSARYPVDEIVIHCAATHPDWMRGQPLTAKRKEIDRWHREERGWRKIGYRCEHSLMCSNYMPACSHCGIGMPTVSGPSGILECSHCGADHHQCPKCSDGWLVEKHGRYGDFFSCVRYPDCTGKASVAEIRAREMGQVGGVDELRLAFSRPVARKQ